MPEFDDLRALARDRQKKAGAGGTWKMRVPIDISKIEELDDLIEQRPTLPPLTGKEKARLGSAPADRTPPVDEELEALIDAKQDEIAATSITLLFRTTSSVNYQRIMNDHPDMTYYDDNGNKITNEAKWADFANELAKECLAEVTDHAGKKWEDTWAELCANTLSYGEWETACMSVVALNRRRVDVPKSQRRSDKTR